MNASYSNDIFYKPIGNNFSKNKELSKFLEEENNKV